MAAVKRKQENSATKDNRKKPKVESRSATAVKKATAPAAAVLPRITEVESDDELEPSLDAGGDDDDDDDNEDDSEDDDEDVDVKDTATTKAPAAKTAEERMFQFLVPLPCRNTENKGLL